jgi:hypothetical protein
MPSYGCARRVFTHERLNEVRWLQLGKGGDSGTQAVEKAGYFGRLPQPSGLIVVLKAESNHSAAGRYASKLVWCEFEGYNLGHQFGLFSAIDDVWEVVESSRLGLRGRE